MYLLVVAPLTLPGAKTGRGVRLSFRIFVKGGGANTTIAELKGGEDYSNTSCIFIHKRIL